MIIEIKDLPSGRKVSRILVDITFEDSLELVEQEILSSDVTMKSPMKSPIKTSESSVESTVETSAEKGSGTISVESRASVDIPDEMLNMEF